MYVVFIFIFFSCPWSPTSAPHSQVKPGLVLFLRKRMDPLLFSDGPFHSPETCMTAPDVFLQCNQPLDSKCPPNSPPSMHLISGLGDRTLCIDSRASNPASIPLASPAGQMRKKLPCLLLSSGERCLVVMNELTVGVGWAGEWSSHLLLPTVGKWVERNLVATLYFFILGSWYGQDFQEWAFLVKRERSLQRNDLF